MEVSPTTATNPVVQPPTAKADQEISSDFETFLRMLTVQLQNQDPLNPVESTEFAEQLATFSGVEQAVLTNDLLSTMIGQMNSGNLANMANWVGKEARAKAPAFFEGTPITLEAKAATAADRAEIVVKDESGTIVQRVAVSPSADEFTWAGVSPSGTPFEKGLYSFEIVSLASEQVIEETQIPVYAKVTEIQVQDNETVLILEGGAVVSSGDVTAIRDPSTS